MRHLGFAISIALHALFLALLIFGGPLFTPEEDDPIQIVDAAFISAEEFDELVKGPTPEPAAAAPPPLTPPTPPTPEVEQPETEPPAPDPPYQDAPDTPSPLVFEEQAPPDEAAAIDVPAPNRVPVAPAPAQPVAAVRDEAPEPDQPDEPPVEQEVAAEDPPPEPEEPPAQEEVAEAQLAPAAVPRPTPSRRPRQVAEADPPEPEQEPEQEPEREDPPEEQPEQPAQPQQRQPQQAERRRAPVVGPPLSRFERDGFQLALRRCWNPPDSGGVDPASLSVRLYLEMARDGRVVGKPKLLSPKPPLSTRQQAAIRAAAVAVQRCQPFRLPPGKYGHWQEIRVTFDPAQGILTQ